MDSKKSVEVVEILTGSRFSFQIDIIRESLCRSVPETCALILDKGLEVQLLPGHFRGTLKTPPAVPKSVERSPGFALAVHHK